MTLAAILLLADLRIASVIPSKPTLTTDETFSVAVKVRNARDEEAKDVKVTIGVNALSFEVRAGEMLGLIGPDGAGKTSTIRLAGWLLQADT